MPCEKAPFSDAATARRRILEIAGATDSRQLGMLAREAHIPIRAYQCEACGLWHLTSQSNQQRKDLNRERLEQQAARRRNWFEREADYWLRKLGLRPEYQPKRD